ncbi:MAG: hypothetical protein OXE96_00670 [Gemmatimonadetes bacterium]|nr:hypothetical protein [Gemmatimonadota bacterium]
MKSTRFCIGASSLHPLRTLAVAALAATAGCASGTSGTDDASEPTPQQTRTVMRVGGYAPVEIYNEPGVGARVVAAEAEVVWSVLGGVYAQLDIPVTASNPRTMEIGNPGYSARRVGGDRMNTFVDCGSDLSGALANLFEITLLVTTKLTSKGEDGTEVLTLVDAWGEPRGVSGNPVHCQSRGVLELRVAQEVAEALGIGS